MAMGKGYRIFHKVPPDRETPYSVIMESKAKEESLMFESNAVVSLGKYQDILKRVEVAARIPISLTRS